MSLKQKVATSLIAPLLLFVVASTETRVHSQTGGESQPSGVTRAAVQGAGGPRRCFSSEQINLTGTFDVVLYLGKDDKEGASGVLKIDGNDFEITSKSLKGAGVITGVNSCGDVAVALRFKEVSGVTEEAMRRLTASSISLDMAGAGMKARENDNLPFFAGTKPTVLSTTKTLGGKAAGAQIICQICPTPPCSRTRYRKCPKCVD